MKNFKGTKGKWQVKVSNEYSGDYSIFTENGSPNRIEDESNALLISKAPEMLEMLAYLFENDYISNISNVKKVSKLIKEATEL